MKKTLLTLFAVLMITVPAFAQTTAGNDKTTGDDGAAPAVKTTASIKPMHHAKPVQHERHPLIHGAMNKLRQAKEKLRDADRDHGGHRVKAIAAIDQALAELKLVLMSDKK